ncbi:MAG: hypothetical protein PW788_02215 [Micavibrio sp.]|nr:hypothetical protein [Micavibrio sp.]
MLQKVKSAIAPAPRRSESKTFHLNSILSVVTGLVLSREGAVGPQRLIAFMLESDAVLETSFENEERVRDCVLEQLPFLSEISMQGLAEIIRYDAAPDNPYLKVWLEMQHLRFGEDHGLVPLSRWQEQKKASLLSSIN